MPTVAPSSRVKRLMCHQAVDGEAPNKRPHLSSRVHFDPKVEVLPSDKSDGDEPMPDAFDEQEDVDFVLSVGEDGDWDFTISSDKDAPPAKDTKKRPLDGAMPLPSANTKEHDEEEPLLRVSSNNSLGNNLTISLKACDDADDSAEPMPLITPPSSPRRIRTLSFDGQTEEATICEWPCNLTVDNAITAAVEAGPLALPRGE